MAMIAGCDVRLNLREYWPLSIDRMTAGSFRSFKSNQIRSRSMFETQ